MKIQKAYSTTDVHVAGEVFRICGDAPFIHCRNLGELYEKFPNAYHEEKNLLLNEPRGFAGLNGCLVLPPFNDEADAAALFFNHEGTIPVHYGGIVAMVTALLECGQLPVKTSGEYKIETVHGVVPINAHIENDEVVEVKMESGPYQVIETDLYHPVLNAEYSLVKAGGLHAVFSDHRLGIHVDRLAELKHWGQKAFQGLDPSVKRAILMDGSALEGGYVKSVTFREDHFIVRSPGFASTFACYASLLSKGGMPADQPFFNESIFGSRLEIRSFRETGGGYRFTIACRGFVTGMHTFVLDPTDPLPAGFLLK